MPMTIASLRPILAIDEDSALRRFASERDISLDEAAAVVIREYLIAGGWLKCDEDRELVGLCNPALSSPASRLYPAPSCGSSPSPGRSGHRNTCSGAGAS
jgi:hypothetical protein